MLREIRINVGELGELWLTKRGHLGSSDFSQKLTLSNLSVNRSDDVLKLVQSN